MRLRQCRGAEEPLARALRGGRVGVRGGHGYQHGRAVYLKERVEAVLGDHCHRTGAAGPRKARARLAPHLSVLHDDLHQPARRQEHLPAGLEVHVLLVPVVQQQVAGHPQPRVVVGLHLEAVVAAQRGHDCAAPADGYVVAAAGDELARAPREVDLVVEPLHGEALEEPVVEVLAPDGGGEGVPNAQLVDTLLLNAPRGDRVGARAVVRYVGLSAQGVALAAGPPGDVVLDQGEELLPAGGQPGAVGGHRLHLGGDRAPSLHQGGVLQRAGQLGRELLRIVVNDGDVGAELRAHRAPALGHLQHNLEHLVLLHDVVVQDGYQKGPLDDPLLEAEALQSRVGRGRYEV
mmetsp:Transcript_10041/g.22304  ORF Transcript_10041/g.22304 Transcript_10041/m.22304 type:complete len:347 (-) Transcript_10041:1233-2273(-)